MAKDRFILVEFVRDLEGGNAPIGLRLKGDRAELRDWIAEDFIARGIARRVAAKKDLA